MKTNFTEHDLLRVREDIINMQQWVANNEPDSKNPDVRELVNNLLRTRSSIERIMIENHF